MISRWLRSVALTGLVAGTLAFVTPNVYAQSDPQAHIAASEVTLSDFLGDPNMDWLQRNFGRAKAVMITPLIVKAGFIFGGSGGRALVVARDPTSGKWLGPAFYAIATASVGFQAGISVAEGVTLVITDNQAGISVAEGVTLVITDNQAGISVAEGVTLVITDKRGGRQAARPG